MEMFRFPIPTRSKRAATREGAPHADRQLERVRDRNMVARGIQL
jgi:hypothetical protein